MWNDPGRSAPTGTEQPYRTASYAAPYAPPVEATPEATPEATQPATRSLRHLPAILTLLLLGGLIPETIATSNTPPVAYLDNPVLFGLICVFYGCAALLLREAWRARHLGWTSVILLGVSFGAMNEGVIAGKWWMIPAKGYTLTGGVNWGWATALTIFHIVYSMVIPILVVEALFPRVAGEPWLRRRGLLIAAILLGLTQLLGLLARDYQPYRALALAFALVFIPLALLLPRARPRAVNPCPAPGLWRLRITGYFAALVYFILIFFVPGAWSPPTPVIVGVLVAYFAVCLWWLRMWAGRSGWGRRQELALLTGVLVPNLLIVSFQPGGEIFVTVPFFALLVWLAFRERDLERRGSPAMA